MIKLANAAEVESKLDELVPRRSAGSGLCRNELDLHGFTCHRGDLKTAVQSRKMKAGTSATAFSDSAELADAQTIEDWIDSRNESGQVPLLTSVAVVESIMERLGFHAASEADIVTAVAARRQGFIDGED